MFKYYLNPIKNYSNLIICPLCKADTLESQWCSKCKGKGLIEKYKQ